MHVMDLPYRWMADASMLLMEAEGYEDCESCTRFACLRNRFV